MFPCSDPVDFASLKYYFAPNEMFVVPKNKLLETWSFIQRNKFKNTAIVVNISLGFISYELRSEY